MKSLAVGTTCLSSSGPDGGCSRLSVRNGRSVVHKNLEDNYGAVISANHEALAQILEQVSSYDMWSAAGQIIVQACMHHHRVEIGLKILQLFS